MAAIRSSGRLSSDEADAAAGGGGGGGEEGSGAGSGTKRRADENGEDRHDPQQPAEEKKKKLSRRQKRKLEKLKPRNVVAMPHPRMQSAEARARQHVRTAGFVVRDKKDGGDNSDRFDPNSPEIRFGRLLGSTDHRTRHGAVMHLRAYLKARCGGGGGGGGGGSSSSSDPPGLSELDLLKLWKGLWYTLYMADQVSVQVELSKHLSQLLWCVAGTPEEDECAAQMYLDMSDDAMNELEGGEDDDEEDGEGAPNLEMLEAEEDGSGNSEGSDDDDDDDDEDVTMEEIVNTLRREEEDASSSGSDDEEEEDGEDVDYSLVPHCRGAHLVSLMVGAFFATVQREWGKMDKYRLDKFYTLTRMVVREMYSYAAARSWSLGVIRLINDAVYEHVLSRTPNGLRFHLIDVVLPELAAVESEAPIRLTEATFLDIIEPYFALAQTGGGGDSSGDDLVQRRVVDKILIPFLDEYSVYSGSSVGSDDDGDDDGEGGKKERPVFRQVHVGTIAQFIFEVASDPETPDKYRKSLYDLHKHYRRRINELGEDRDVELMNGIEEDDDEEEEEEEDYDVDDHDGDEDQDAEGLPELDGHGDQPSFSDDNGSSGDSVGGQNEKEVRRNSKETAAPRDDNEVPLTKKKSKKNEEAATGTKQTDEPQQEERDRKEGAENPSSSGKKKKKKKKKKRKDSDASEGSEKPVAKQDADLTGEEEITISVKEQKDAISAMFDEKKEKKKRRASDASDDVLSDKKKRKKKKADRSGQPSSDEDKRVKFGTAIKARSYQASMKRLRTRDPPTPAEATPEQGILRNKQSEIKKVRGNQRPKAIDYF